MRRLEFKKGQKNGRLTFLEDSDNINGRPAGKFKCECGAILIANLKTVNSGGIQSCGCLNIYTKKTMHLKHGQAVNPPKGSEYNSWRGMNERCENKNHKKYDRYGGRGISVCERWRNSFSSFLEDMGPRPSQKHTLERVENGKGYYKENCKWATKAEQMNNRSNNIKIRFLGETLNLSEWCRRLNLSYGVINSRINRSKWTPYEAISTPIGAKRNGECHPCVFEIRKFKPE